jgi:hypothetical protein
MFERCISAHNWPQEKSSCSGLNWFLAFSSPPINPFLVDTGFESQSCLHAFLPEEKSKENLKITFNHLLPTFLAISCAQGASLGASLSPLPKVTSLYIKPAFRSQPSKELQLGSRSASCCLQLHPSITLASWSARVQAVVGWVLELSKLLVAALPNGSKRVVMTLRKRNKFPFAFISSLLSDFGTNSPNCGGWDELECVIRKAPTPRLSSCLITLTNRNIYCIRLFLCMTIILVVEKALGIRLISIFAAEVIVGKVWTLSDGCILRIIPVSNWCNPSVTATCEVRFTSRSVRSELCCQ